MDGKNLLTLSLQITGAQYTSHRLYILDDLSLYYYFRVFRVSKHISAFTLTVATVYSAMRYILAFVKEVIDEYNIASYSAATLAIL